MARANVQWHVLGSCIMYLYNYDRKTYDIFLFY